MGMAQGHLGGWQSSLEQKRSLSPEPGVSAHTSCCGSKRPEFRMDRKAETSSQQQGPGTSSVPGPVHASTLQPASRAARRAGGPQAQVQSTFRAWTPDSGWDRARRDPTSTRRAVQGPPASR